MISVTKEQFYRAIGGPENIHPTAHRDRSDWVNLHTGELVGRTEPGYASPYGAPAAYKLTPKFAERKGLCHEQHAEGGAA